jgi:hypothetical protein
MLLSVLLPAGAALRHAPPTMSGAGARKVVVTGISTITSLGKTADETFSNLLDGKCGIGPLTLFDPKDYPPVPQIASEVSDFDVRQFWKPPEGRPDGVGFQPEKYDRYIHFAVAAATACLSDAKLDPSTLANRYRFGCMIASGAGGIGTLEENCRSLFYEGAEAVSGPDPLGTSNTASQVVAMEVGACGPNANYVSACASGTHALGEAFRAIAYGGAEVRRLLRELCTRTQTDGSAHAHRPMALHTHTDRWLCTRTQTDGSAHAHRPMALHTHSDVWPSRRDGDEPMCGFSRRDGRGAAHRRAARPLSRTEPHARRVHAHARARCGLTTSVASDHLSCSLMAPAAGTGDACGRHRGLHHATHDLGLHVDARHVHHEQR